jgi:leucyl aminopeptidase (aminopeptidase T)
VRAGELVQVRDGAGRPEILEAVNLAVEIAGGTPVVELSHPAYLRALLGAVPPEVLARWHERRVELMGRYDRVIALHGDDRGPAGVPSAAWDAWVASAGQVTHAEEERRLPMMVLAVPTAGRAAACGLTLDQLDARLRPALVLGARELLAHTHATLGPVAAADHLVLRSAGGRELHLHRHGRAWMVDDGLIDDDDRACGAIVSNLPAGSAYTTVEEGATEGEVVLDALGGATGVVLRFEAGRGHVVSASGRSAGEVDAWLGRFDGEPRRVGHVGIGTNPALAGDLGWVLPDHGAAGRMWVSLGENRYMGGQNASSLNVDAVVSGGTLHPA